MCVHELGQFHFDDTFTTSASAANRAINTSEMSTISKENRLETMLE